MHQAVVKKKMHKTITITSYLTQNDKVRFKKDNVLEYIACLRSIFVLFEFSVKYQLTRVYH